MGVEVKICGLTRQEDAVVAAEAGAAWVGMVFAAGPRQVGMESARRVLEAVPEAVGRVGVFPAQPASAILDAVRFVGLDAAQLHFDEGAAEIAMDLKREGVPVWRVLRLDGEDSCSVPDETCADVVLVERRVPGKSGGTGEPIDLETALRVRRAVSRPVRFALAGGLTPMTVRAAVECVRPDIVDVSSGVEVWPGVKDHERVRRFIEAAGAVLT